MIWSVLDATNAGNEWLHQQTKEVYLQGLQKQQDKCGKCICPGKYVE